MSNYIRDLSSSIGILSTVYRVGAEISFTCAAVFNGEHGRNNHIIPSHLKSTSFFLCLHKTMRSASHSGAHITRYRRKMREVGVEGEAEMDVDVESVFDIRKRLQGSDVTY